MNNNKDQINVLFLSYHMPMGGSHKLTVDMLKAFSGFKNITNTLVVLNEEIDENFKKELSNINIEMKVFSKTEYKKNKFKILLELINIIKKNNIQILYFGSLIPKKWSIVLKFLMPKLKLVYTVHDTNLFRKFSKFNILAGNIFVDKHVGVSKAVSKECINSNAKKVYQIDNGINLENFYKNKAIIDKDFDCLNIINVSRINLPKKGQDVLIKALGECKQRGIKFNCKFVGDFDKDPENDIEFKDIEKMVRDANINDEIEFLGRREDIPELLAASSLFILPSRFEGMPLVLIEAMAAGLPVIASNISGSDELIIDNKTGILFECDNYLDLADKITELYNDREKFVRVAQDGFEFSKNYDIKVMCQKYFDLYKETIRK